MFVDDLARWILDFPQTLPAPVLHRAKLAILDSLACAIAALHEDEAQRTLAMIEDLGGHPQCQVIGTRLRTSVLNGVLANGLLIRALDSNDFLGGGRLGGHPSDNIAVALSVGDWRDVSGHALLSSVVMAYELYGRLQALIDRKAPWDHTTASGLVAPAIAGRLMQLSPTQLAHALALSASRSPTLAAIRSGHISSAKMFANALVAQSGTLATLLAARDMTGPRGLFEHARGTAHTLDAAMRDTLVAPLPSSFRIMDATVKAYPCIGTGQAAVAAALQVDAQYPNGLPPGARIAVRMADSHAVRVQIADEDRRRPGSREAADHSFPFLIAAALIDGELTLRQFENARWHDPRVVDLMARITITADAALGAKAPDGFPCAIQVETTDGPGAACEVIHAPGHPHAGPPDAVVLAKFKAATDGIMSKPAQDAAVAQTMALEDCASVKNFMRAFAV